MDNSDSTTVDADSLRSYIRDKSVRVIDIRREEEFKKSHIPTSVNLPLATLLSDDSPEKVVKFVKSFGIDDETPVVVYDNTFGALASRVAWTLEYIGHSNVSLLDVTFDKWNESGLETSNEITEHATKNHSVKLRPEILATADYLETVKNKENSILIDNRERLNYLEQHIPGAMNVPYRMLASPDNVLRQKQDLKRLFDNRNISSNCEIVTYCGSVGTLSGLGYYALKKAGIPNVKLYVRSFKEWKSLEKPTETQESASYWDLSAE